MSATLSAALTEERPDYDARLVQTLIGGDESTFLNLVHRENAAMIRYAGLFVSTRTAAEEVVREAWRRIVTGLARYEGGSLRSWMFGVVAGCARSHCAPQGRSVPGTLAEDAAEAAVDPDRFFSPGSPNAGGWRKPPEPWPDDCARRPEIVEFIRESIARLSLLRRQVFFLRDVEGWSAKDVCALLGITESQQRLLLQRARSRVRNELERRLAA